MEPRMSAFETVWITAVYSLAEDFP